MSRDLLLLFRENNLTLTRQRKHLVFRHAPSGKNFVCSKTPSCRIAEQQILSSLKRFLRTVA
jgi:hypothetical protein